MSVANFIEAQDDAAQRELLWALDEFILQLLPQAGANIKWQLPCYDYCGLLCYLNPQRRGGVALGFMQGRHLSNAEGLLQGEGKQVRHVHIANLKDVHSEALARTLMEAALYNEAQKAAKRRR